MTDTTGATVPGVVVVLSSPGIIGGNQQIVTDERGRYQFTTLVPGSAYTVTAELSGFRPAIREEVVVNAAATARVDLILAIGDLEEAVTVSGRAPLLDIRTVTNQTVMDRATLDTLPTSNDIWSIGRVVPSVIMSRYDVGGSESLSQYAGTVHGSTWQDAAYLVDGLDTSNPAGTTSATYFDVAMFEETNYVAGNATAEHEKGGLIYNLVTKTGTNRFQGWTNFTGTNEHLNSSNLSADLTADLLASVPSRVLEANPNFVPSAQLLTYYDLSVGLTGPIIPDTLWFAVSGETKRLDQLRVGAYNLDGTQGLDDNTQTNRSWKLSWQPTQSNRIHYLHQFNNRVNLHRANTLAQVTEFYESRAMLVQDLESPIDQLRWIWTVSSNVLLDVSASRYFPVIVQSMQPEVQIGDIPGFDVLTRTYTVAQGSYPNRPEYPRHYATASLDYYTGRHNFKIGYQYNHGWYVSDGVSVSHHPSGLRAVFRDGVPDSVNTYNTPTSAENHILDQAFYAHDTWTPTPKVTLNVGLRFQKSTGWVPEACQVQTIFIEGRCFDRIDDVPNWFDVSPRFGIIYDVFGDGSTAIKGSANRYYLTRGASHAARVNPIRVTSDTRSWDDRNGDLIPQLDELGPSTGFNLGTSTRYAEDVERPYANEFSLGVERQLPYNIVASATYFRRQTRRGIGSRNLALPTDSYAPFEVVEVGSGEPVTVYNQDPALRGQFDVLLDNADELDSSYHGLDLTVNKRLSDRWMILGGVSLNENLGDIYGVNYNTADLNDPNYAFRRGLVEFDVPVSIKVSGSYEFPYGVLASANLQHFTGFPELDTVTVGPDTVPLTQVRQTVVVQPRGTNRLPNVNAIDLALRKVFRFRDGVTVDAAMEMFNLTDANTVQGRVTTLGPAYHRVTSIMRGRMIRFGANLKF